MSEENNETSYQMLWDCTACGTQRLLGIDHRYCPNCGSAQNPDKRYFPEEGQEVAAAGHVYSGKDWICQYCNTAGSAAASCCTSCGAPKDGTKEVKTQADEGPAVEAAKTETKVAEETAQSSGKMKWVVIGVVSFILLLLGLVVVNLFWTKNVQFEVTGHQWHRSIQIEEMRTVVDSGFCKNLGSGAKIFKRDKKESGSKQVADGKDCKTKKVDKGDGTFKKEQVCTDKYKSVPEYSEFCYYQENRWLPLSMKNATGSNLSPDWPTYTLARSGVCVGCQRPGQKKEEYKVLLKSKEGTPNCTVSQDKWKTMAVGNKYVGKVGKVGGGLQCGSLQPVK